MKLSAATIDILKNFSSINTGILIRQGSELRTASPLNSALAIASVEETFPRQVAIYDLSKFLGVISMFNEPDIEFHEKFLTITNDQIRVVYNYADESMVTKPTTGNALNNKVAEFQLVDTTLTKALRASSIMGLTDFRIEAKDGQVSVVIHDAKKSSSNEYRVHIKQIENTANFEFNLRVERLKFMPLNYKVEVHQSSAGKFIVLFDSTGLNKLDVQYWITTEKESYLKTE